METNTPTLSPATRSETPQPSIAAWRHAYFKLLCAFFGHRVNNSDFARRRGLAKRCRCGSFMLAKGGEETRIGHTVSCFLFGHHYSRTGCRNGYWEFVCDPCGHPLLLPAYSAAYAQKQTMRKTVRYRCNLFGHRAQRVTERSGQTEYACPCGHTFLKRERNATLIKHPLVCLFAGHYVRYAARRVGYAEYFCRNCGHPFCFAD